MLLTTPHVGVVHSEVRGACAALSRPRLARTRADTCQHVHLTHVELSSVVPLESVGGETQPPVDLHPSCLVKDQGVIEGILAT